MGLSRRFQNLILDSPYEGAKWLRRVDLTRLLFGKTATPQSAIGHGSESTAVQDYTSRYRIPSSIYMFRKTAAQLNMKRIRLPSPIFRFEDAALSDDVCRFKDTALSGDVSCFPLSSSKVVLADQTGRTFLLHADTCSLVPMPNLSKPKSKPISLYVPSADGQSSSYGSLYIMETRLMKPEKGSSTQPSDQFEALVHVKGSSTSEGMWHSRCLPLPPFIYSPAYKCSYPGITSYAVVGTRICISIDHKATYWLDTMNDTWEVGNGVLSTFEGKLEYVPELKLWFGFSAKAMQLAAVDLSARDIPVPAQLVGDCTEFDVPKGFLECEYPQLVNLGSGRFCITRFFESFPRDDEMIVMVAVFTGVEVTPVLHDGNCSGSRNGEVKLQMKKHNSTYHVCNATMIRRVV